VVPVMPWWVRGTLLLMATGLITVFTIAIRLNPYVNGGTARTMETHRQLGLPPCTFYALTGLPCPSCGMTTSFSLLMHGDVVHSVRANAVGTLLAVFCLALIPWCLASAALGRLLFVTDLEAVLIRLIIAFLVLMLGRWVIVLTWLWLTHTHVSPGG
jgi:hypothetical protein